MRVFFALTVRRSSWHRLVAPLAVLLAACAAPPPARDAIGRPNVVVIFCDDLGYGDLGCYGHPTLRTPNLDRMAAEGQRWTSFYVAASVCTPSRAGLLTGRLPIRTGMCSNRRRVLFPNSGGGLPQDEITIAEALADGGYATACVGKWHLGHRPEFLPTRHGFAEYFGIPYSNDMDRVASAPRGRRAFDDPRIAYWNVPLLRGEDVAERPADQTTITRRYTDEAVRFIEANRSQPFFLYLAHSLPHVPLFRSPEFEGHSERGLYGDVVEEIDAGVGRILARLRELGLDRRTLVVFTSDNGPWLSYGRQGGSAGLLSGGKGSTMEGGMRVPAVFWWPGSIRPGVVSELGSTLDLLPTLCSLGGVAAPARVLDGSDLGPALLGRGPSPREEMFFYRGTEVFACRVGPFKAHFKTRAGYGQRQAEAHDPPRLYHLGVDPSERHDIAARHPDVVEAIRARVVAHRSSFEPPPSQLEISAPAR